MNNVLQFSVLSYFPSMLSEERINVGIAYLDKLTYDTKFVEIKKWTRVEHFDDEIDVDFLKHTVSGIKLRIENNMFSESIKSLSEVTRHFVNELKFSMIEEVEYDELHSAIDCINKIHLRFDFEKHERNSQENEKTYLRMIYKNKQYSFNSSPLQGAYDEQLNFDFVLNDKECVKIVRLSDRNLATAVHHAKSWAFTCNEMNDVYKFVFLIVEEDYLDKNRTNQIKSILKSCNSKVVDYNRYIQNLPGSSLFDAIERRS